MNAISGQREAQGAAEWRKVAEFWSSLGAEIMVRNALCASEMTSWLKRFSVVCADIRYIGGVSAVFKAKLAGKKAEEFPYYEDGNMDEKAFVKRQIALLQAGIVNFEFLSYIEANSGISCQELVDVFKQVYPKVEGEEKEEESVEVVHSKETEKMQDAIANEGTKAGTSVQVAPKVSEVSGQIGEAE